MHVDPAGRIRGIASRIQECPPHKRSYDTYTIRKARDSGTKTEYAKLKEAIDAADGQLYAQLRVQGYITRFEGGSLRSFAVGKSDVIVSAIDAWEQAGQPPHGPIWTNRTSNASFYVVRWVDPFVEYVFRAGQLKQRAAQQLPLLAAAPA